MMSPARGVISGVDTFLVTRPASSAEADTEVEARQRRRSLEEEMHEYTNARMHNGINGSHTCRRTDTSDTYIFSRRAASTFRAASAATSAALRSAWAIGHKRHDQFGEGGARIGGGGGSTVVGGGGGRIFIGVREQATRTNGNQ